MKTGTLLTKFMFALALGCALAVPSAPVQAQGTMQQMLKDRTVKVGWIPAPPTAYRDPKTGEVTGIYIDVVKFIMEQAKIKVEFVESSWSTFPAGLQAKQFDLVAAGTFSSIPRATAVSFTRPIFYLGYTMGARKGDTRFKTIADIDKPGIKVSVVLGSGGHEYVKRAVKNAEIVALNSSDLTASLAAVAAGRADVAVEDAWATARYSAEHPEIVNVLEDRPFNLQPIGWPVRQGDGEFLDFMNTSLEWMRVNGMIESIVGRYPKSGRYVIEDSYRSLDKR